MKKTMLGVLATTLLAGCQTMGGLTVKDYTAPSGERVMAGQAAPKTEYACTELGREKQDWGLGGNMDRVGATRRVTATAVAHAPSKGANYAEIQAPAQVGIGSLNVNALADAWAVYYRCASLPPARAQ